SLFRETLFHLCYLFLPRGYFSVYFSFPTRRSSDLFREEVGGKGVSSYPHPWLMPDYWQFPTVSMGLGPLMAIYHARFMRYLEHRDRKSTRLNSSHVKISYAVFCLKKKKT